MGDKDRVGEGSPIGKSRVGVVLAQLDAVQASPTEACDTDGEASAVVFAKCFEESGDSWPSYTESISDQEGNELEHRGENIVAGWRIQSLLQDHCEFLSTYGFLNHDSFSSHIWAMLIMH